MSGLVRDSRRRERGGQLLSVDHDNGVDPRFVPQEAEFGVGSARHWHDLRNANAKGFDALVFLSL